MSRPGRFDNAFMRPPEPHDAVDKALRQRIRAWCETGAVPHLTEPLAVASIAPHAGLDGVACELDGRHALARLGRWQGWAWRLQVMARDHLAYRPDRGDPWDCGWWREGPLDIAAAFRPRRATLLLVDEQSHSVSEALLATLRVGRLSYSRPVRVLLVCTSLVVGIPALQ
ncbi:hypothetical protein BH11PSE8_BH11PSE8_30420 [soil metagenome]